MSGLRSVCDAVSAKLADASQSSVHDLSPKKDENAKIEPSDLLKGDASLDRFLRKHDDCLLMVFAPWCPHCKTAMPNFEEAATTSDIPFAKVNAEMVSPKTLRGKDDVPGRVFPFLLRIKDAERKCKCLS